MEWNKERKKLMIFGDLGNFNNVGWKIDEEILKIEKKKVLRIFKENRIISDVELDDKRKNLRKEMRM